VIFRRRRRPAPLSCQEMVELVTDYLEGALDEPTRRRFDEHLACCDGCSAYLDQMRETIVMVGRLEKSDFPPDARAKLMAAFEDWKTDRG
jgi:predicted anti-sigma-YlaC factor YlaD